MVIWPTNDACPAETNVRQILREVALKVSLRIEISIGEHISKAETLPPPIVKTSTFPFHF